MKLPALDGWLNVLRGLGGRKDTAQSTYFQKPLKTLNQQEINGLYSTDWIAKKVVDIPIDDSLKDDRELQCDNPEMLEQFTEFYNLMDLDNKVKTSLKWSRAFGGAVIVLVTNDDEMDKPLIIENLKQNCIKNIVALDRWSVYSTDLELNPLSKRYLKPNYYYLTENGTPIHYSRVIHLDGETTTNRMRQDLNGWGLSIFEKGWEVIQTAGISPNLISNLLVQSNIDVYKILGLNDALASSNDDLVMKRLQVIQESKSIFNGIALDKEDDYINISKNFAGLRELNTEFYQLVAGAYDIPFTRFIGTSSTGLSATGEGDLSNYYDMIKSLQDSFKPIYNKLDLVIQYHLFGKEVGIHYEFKSLWQLSDLEKATMQKTKADIDAIYLDKGVVNEMDVKSRLSNELMYPTITPESVAEEALMYNELQELEPIQEEEYNQPMQDAKIEKDNFLDSIKQKFGL